MVDDSRRPWVDLGFVSPRFIYSIGAIKRVMSHNLNKITSFNLGIVVYQKCDVGGTKYANFTDTLLKQCQHYFL